MFRHSVIAVRLTSLRRHFLHPLGGVTVLPARLSHIPFFVPLFLLRVRSLLLSIPIGDQLIELETIYHSTCGLPSVSAPYPPIQRRADLSNLLSRAILTRYPTRAKRYSMKYIYAVRGTGLKGLIIHSWLARQDPYLGISMAFRMEDNAEGGSACLHRRRPT